MRNFLTKETWEQYRDDELRRLTSILAELGFTLESEQPHIKGERFLMQAVSSESGRKLILLARRVSNNERVVVKATSDPGGKVELKKEKERREVVHKMKFAYQVFFTPKEILFEHRGGFTISIQKFIEQERPFTERTLKEQFDLALKAFKAQEGAHATTYGHIRLARHYFNTINAQGYLTSFENFKKNTLAYHQSNDQLKRILEKAGQLLKTHQETVEQYSGFLTHTDFVPHNIRVADGNIYLLDHSSLRFGNKYEGWARFLNFMLLYNPPLEQALVRYVRDNRAPEELRSLQLMRIYRLGEIIWYYSRSLAYTTGDLNTLNAKRVDFWSKVLEAVLENEPVSKEVIEDYKRMRDSLRSEEEKRRQMGLH